jgi:hypothetical protein
MWQYFYGAPPLYVDKLKNEKRNLCFKNMFGGQGSTFGLKSLDLSRAVMLREFRDFVIDRIVKRSGIPMPPQRDMILVGLRTTGAAGGAIINNLCDLVKHGLAEYPQYESKYEIVCFHPSLVSFEDEIRQVQQAKILISVHGTISYFVYMSREGTKQISIANPKELKENQMLLSGTHFHTLYLTWDRLRDLPPLLGYTIGLSEEYFHPNYYDN